MDGHDVLAERFEAHRGHLRAVAYRMLGSSSDADDAVQETWLRFDGADVSGVKNLAGWLTTVIARVCLDMLRSRKARREDPIGEQVSDQIRDAGTSGDPEHEAMLADSVGRALLVVLDTLTPAERIALVLHDMFAVPFEEIAPIVGRSQATTKKLASRARQRVKGTPAVSGPELAGHRHVVDAFIAAIRAGDIDGLIAVLDPDVVRRVDRAGLPAGARTEIRGARDVAAESVVLARTSRFAEPALVDGTVGIVVAPWGRLLRILTLSIRDGRITEYEVIADPARMRRFTLAVLDY